MKKFDLGDWLTPIESCDRLPPGIRREADPIYAPMATEGYSACRTYFDQARVFLEGSGQNPAVGFVLKSAIPHGCFLAAELAEDALGPKVLLKIEDLDRRFEKDERSPRWFDPEYVPALIMLTYAGGSFRFDDKRPKKDAEGNPTEPNKRRMIVSFGRGTDGNVSLLRIIADAPAGYQVHRISAKSDPNYHYEYRSAALALRSDDRVRAEGKQVKTARRGRRYAIQLAGSYLERAIARGETLADPHLTRDQYEKLLHEMFETADAGRRARTGTKGG